jgi:hypothetical protein
MKTIIACSRTIVDYNKLSSVLESLSSDLKITEVVCGTEMGMDQLGKQWAENNGIPVKEFPPNWDKFGKAACYIRNREMALYADAAVILWDGQSRGTEHMINLSVQTKLKLFVFTI